MDVVSADSLSFQYAGQRTGPALTDCSFRVREGEIYGLLGPNGAGKTTLLRLLGTLLLPGSGRLDVLGHTLPGGEKAILEHLGLAVGDYERTFHFRLSGRENLRYFAAFYPGIPRSEARERVDEALRIVDLESHGNALYHTYSQGMKHRLALARALIHRPRLLLLDEPTSGLDAATSADFLARMRDLADAGTSIVVATHDLLEAGELCDRVLILKEGRRVAEERPEALRNLASDEDVLDLALGPTTPPEFLGDVEILEHVTGIFALPDGRLRIHYRRNTDTAFTVFALARKAGLHLRDVHHDTPSLRDAFLRLTNGGGGS